MDKIAQKALKLLWEIKSVTFATVNKGEPEGTGTLLTNRTYLRTLNFKAVL
jgi:hypothetical protein